jgi:hypothetical protein
MKASKFDIIVVAKKQNKLEAHAIKIIPQINQDDKQLIESL